MKERKHQSQGRPTHFPSFRNRRTCLFCGNNHEMIRDKCPAYGKTCDRCNRPNHFSKMCNSSESRPNKWPNAPRKNKFADNKHSVNIVDETDSSSESLYKIESLNLASKSNSASDKKQWVTNLTFSTRPRPTLDHDQVFCDFECQLDTGASCNVMHKSDFDKIARKAISEFSKPSLKDSSTILRCYSGNTIKPVGETDLVCYFNDKVYCMTFQIVDIPAYQRPLISAETCKQLKILQVKAQLCKVEDVDTSLSNNTNQQDNDIIDEFDDVFTGLGCLPGIFHLEVDATVDPVKNSPRKVSIPLRKQLKEKIDELECQGIIVKENAPTEWISNIVVVMRNGKMRICLDPRPLNVALKRSHYQIPTIDDILPDLSKAKVFSVMDAKNGFWQVKLDEESSKLTTFWTPHGRYRWTRLPFGLAPAPEEFQRRLHEVLYDLEGVAVIADDILIYGCGDTGEEASRDHDRKLRMLLLRAREKNLKLNRKKMKLRQTEVSFMGHVLSNTGLRPDLSKVQAITEMKKPENVKDVQRFLGFVNYLARFVPTLSDLCEPLRQLTKKESAWIWDETHNRSFDKIKQSIANASVLRYFNVHEPLTIQCDSSSIGLGASLLQSGQPVAYASRTLSPVERRYAQIEKECLAILFACNRFHYYISGKSDVTVQTDHQPLVTIFKKALLSAPKRLQCMMLKLQKYNFELEYKKGSEMTLADTLSRAAIPYDNRSRNQEDIETSHVYKMIEEENMFKRMEKVDPTKHLNVTSERLGQIRRITLQDPVLMKLTSVIISGWPKLKSSLDLSIREYWGFRDELVVFDGIVFRGSRLVVPKAMRPEMLQRIHAGHQGIEASLRKAREILYWPRMSEDIRQCIEKCTACLLNSPEQQHLPMQTPDTPDLPWTHIAMDVFDFRGQNYLVTVDYYSDFWELDELPNMTSETLISVSKKNFSRWGVPVSVTTDNAPNFVSSDWLKFSKDWDFEHKTSSPYHPRGNGKAEATVKIAKNNLRRIDRDDADLWLAILEIRNTPAKDVGVSPAQRIMSRRTRTTIPVTRSLLSPEVPSGVKSKLIERKKKYKRYYDRKSKNLPELEVGQGVIVKSRPNVKYNQWEFGSISKQLSDRSYSVKTPSGQFRRNREWIKVTPQQTSKSPTLSPHNSPSPTKTPSEDEMCSQEEHITPREIVSPQRRTTRSGRTIRTPERYKQ
ncbi:uncharacterized protein K02A2.6-like [Macrosteles quadrilineatus]|uniref:uncharacterized protein K02A2.6-like n=1 Tax=Macrosteles quadrilineatus TaxID=74068 RepID=UPI0023E26FCE|nr:uncharacterized protein K02A2.6-like [Macrosteles quadrilineatus]XP_054278888.1 uncharacterized protein K02A2.6-like [Macrosteles quadrilineatus]